MNSLVDDYLLYLSSAISNYSKVLLENNSCIALEKLTDIIYDYLNEVVLLKSSVGDIQFSRILNLKLTEEENSLFNLFLEYGIVDRIKLKDKNIKKSYVFVVDTINYFINIEKYIYKNADFFYSQVFQNVMRSNTYIDKVELKSKLCEYETEIERLYNINRDCIKKLNIKNDTFGFLEQKITKDMLFLNPFYKNEYIYDYNEKKIEYVFKNFQNDIYLNSLEILSVRILKELLENKKNKYFIFIPNYIAKSKNLMNKVIKIFNVYAIEKCAVFVFDASDYLKYKDIENMLEEFDYGLYVNQDNQTTEFSQVKYLFVDYSLDTANFVEKYKNGTDIFINGKVSSKNKEELMDKNIKCYCKIKVGT